MQNKHDLYKNKDVCQMYHFMKRLRQRLGIEMNEGEYKHLVSLVKNQKSTDQYKLRFLNHQSNRLHLYELIIAGKEPVNIVYDKFRKTIVTLLFPGEGVEFTHHYDVFNNKVNILSHYGFSRVWTYVDGMLNIPSEVVEKRGEVFEVVQGNLKGKKFKLDNNDLVEVM